jgi:hypothetical protein
MGTACMVQGAASGMDSVYLETVHLINPGVYYIVVSSYQATPNYDFELYIDRPVGNICEFAEIIPAISPDYFYTGTTFGHGNDYNQGDACSSVFLNANDFVFEYTSPGDEILRMSLLNLNATNDFGLFVLDGCPDDVATTCMVQGAASGTDSVFLETVHLIDPGVYYIVVSSFQATPNYDFELYIDRPVGNICEFAEIIPSIITDYSFFGSTYGHGNDYNQNDGCNNQHMNANDFVFEYTSLGNEMLRMELQNLDATIDFSLFVLDACPDDALANCLVWGDADGTDSVLLETVFLENAGTYYFIVSSFPTSPFYDFELYIDKPVGNICEFAEIIPTIATDYSYFGTTYGHGNDYDQGDGCSNIHMNANDFVFEYTSLGNEMLRMELQNLDATIDFGLFVLDGCPDDTLSNCLVWGDADGTDSVLLETVFLENAGTYYFIVSSFPTSPFYDFELYIDKPVGNTCEFAEIIPAINPDYSFVGTTYGHGDDYDQSNACGTIFMNGNDLVFEYTSPGDEILRMDLQNLDASNDFALFVLDACPDDILANCLVWGDADGSNSVLLETVYLQSAGVYYFVVSSYSGTPFYDFELYIDRPVGNICEFAEIIPAIDPDYTFSGTTYGHGDDYDQGDGCGSIFMNGNDFVFEYTSPGDEVLRMDLQNLDASNDFALFVLDGCPDDTLANCLVWDDTDGTDSVFLETVYLPTAGVYYIVVSSYSGTPSYNFDLHIDRPVGNICENAFPINSIPFSHTGTTYGSGNDYSYGNGCNSVYLNSRDFVFEYYAQQDEYIKIVSQNLNSSYHGLFLVAGCPDTSSTCIDMATTSSGVDLELDITTCLDEGLYYIIVSSYSNTPIVDFQLDVTGFTADITATESSGIINDDTLCYDDAGTTNVSLTATGSGGHIVSDYLYQWDNPSLSTIATIMESPAITTAYSVTLTDDNGCKAYDTHDIIVNSEMAVSITATENSGTTDDDIICFNDAGTATVTLEAIGSGGTITSDYSYQWDDQANSTTAEIQVSPTGTTTYSVTITDDRACTSVMSKTIVVNPELALSINSIDNSGIPDDDIICFDDAGTATVTLEAIGSGGTITSDYSYQWDDPANSTTASILVSPASTTVYSVTITDDKGCTISKSVTITINGVLNNIISASESSGALNDGDICLRDAGLENVLISANPSGGTAGYTYLWDDPANSTTSSISVSPLSTTTYTVSITDLVGCVNTNAQTITVENRTNMWTGPLTGNWNDSETNWSLGRVPIDCDIVIIPSGSTVQVLALETASAYTIFVETGAVLEVAETGEMNVIAPQ